MRESSEHRVICDPAMEAIKIKDSDEALPSQEGEVLSQETDASEVVPEGLSEGLTAVQQNTEPPVHETQTVVKDSLEESVDSNVFVEITVHPEEDLRYIDHGAEDARESLIALLKVTCQANPS